MFAQPSDALPQKRMRSLGVSLLLHCLFLGWVLYSSRPGFLTPSSVVYGENGSTITQLYWPAHDGTAALPGTSTATVDEQAASRTHITWQQPTKKTRTHKRDVPLSRMEPDAPAIASQTGSQATSAGSPYGSAGSGPATGDEVRPALPVSASDPVVSRADLAGVVEGDVVVEITIDEKGSIVQKVVLQTLGAAIDAKVLAALENWRFRPATRNGVAIPSKQDVHYHFRPGNG
jgi:TonB family protein